MTQPSSRGVPSIYPASVKSGDIRPGPFGCSEKSMRIKRRQRLNGLRIFINKP